MPKSKTDRVKAADEALRNAIQECMAAYAEQDGEELGPSLILDSATVVVSQQFDKETGEPGSASSDVFFAGDTPPRYRAFGMLNEMQDALDSFWCTCGECEDDE